MSRELKFRVWDEDHRKFLGNDADILLDQMGGLWEWNIAHEDAPHPIGCKVCVEQFTGLRDKNGKEIFEGDIVKLHKVDEKSFGEKSPLIEIAGFSQKNCEKYNNTAAATTGFFGAILTKKRGSCVGLSWNQAIYEHYEVIGNIHENWELLK